MSSEPADATQASGPARGNDLVALSRLLFPAAGPVCLSTQSASHRLRPLADTDADGDALRRLQEIVHEGPSVETIDGVDILVVSDLSTSDRWREFGVRAVERGVRSLLAIRVQVQSVGVASLVLYAPGVGAFDDADERWTRLLSSFVELLVRAERDRERAENLQVALTSNRNIGVAVGVLMARELLTSEQAFERLRAISQRSHRKLREVAGEVVATGQLPVG